MEQKKIILLIILLSCASLTFAQDSLLLEINSQRLQLNKEGMWVLGSWAAGNMAVSGIMRSQTSGTTRYFHEMNVFWNVVNLGLAGSSLYAVYHSDPGSFDQWQTLAEQQKIEKLLLFNAGLDVAYVMTGFFLRERSLRAVNKPERLRGYGNSLLLQGGFLLVFDLGLYTLLNKQISPQMQELFTSIHISPDGIGWVFSF